MTDRAGSAGWFYVCCFTAAMLTAQVWAQQAATTGLNNNPEDPQTRVYAIVDAAAGQLFGATRDGRWLTSEAAATRLNGSESYRLYNLHGEIAQARGSTPQSPQETCFNWAVEVNVPARTIQQEPVLIGVQGPWDAAPRPARLQSLQETVYHQALSQWLLQHGIEDDNPQLKQIIRVDLDGDATDEVLLSAGNIDARSADAPVGGYSLVLLRKLIDGAVKTIPLLQNYYPQGCQFCAPEADKVMAVLDLNGDGVMEIITGLNYYEGGASIVYELSGAQVTEVLSWACGV
jgi:hypothetical protein